MHCRLEEDTSGSGVSVEVSSTRRHLSEHHIYILIIDLYTCNSKCCYVYLLYTSLAGQRLVDESLAYKTELLHYIYTDDSIM